MGKEDRFAGIKVTTFVTQLLVGRMGVPMSLCSRGAFNLMKMGVAMIIEYMDLLSLTSFPC